MANLAIILLAAGASSRFGHSKQLAIYNGQSLIRHVLNEAQKITANITVVLGAKPDQIKDELQNLPVHIVENVNWGEGMSSSLITGLSATIKRDPAVGAVIVILCDQPFITSSLLEKMISTYSETHKPIVACTYDDTVGTPVLFDSSLFPELLTLTGQAGAKKIVLQHWPSTVTIPFAMGSVDIDTKDQYEDLINNKLPADYGTL